MTWLALGIGFFIGVFTAIAAMVWAGDYQPKKKRDVTDHNDTRNID